MAATFASGPYVSTGNLDPSVIRDSEVGPDMSYQGQGIIDPRFSTYIGASPGHKVYGYYTNPYICLLDGQPQAYNATCLAGGATVACTTAITAANAAACGGGSYAVGSGFQSANLATSVTASAPGSGNIAINVPLCPAGTPIFAGNATNIPVVLEAGYAFGGNIATTVSGTASITLAAAANYKFFRKGQWIGIANGVSAGVNLYTQVTSVTANSATIGVATAPTNTLASGTQVWSMDPSGVCIFPAQIAGVDAFLDPLQSFGRALRVVSAGAGDTTFKLVIRGYDLDMMPMTETITLNGTTAVFGKKAWKYITQLYLCNTASATTAGNISIGTADIFGVPLRSDFWEYMNVFWNGAFITAAAGGAGNGWTAGDTTTATATTGDVKGTLQCGAVGGGSNSFTTSPTGSIKLAAFMSLPVYNAINATNLDSTTMFGVTNYAG